MCSASQPSSRAMTRGDAQRVALLAEQGVAAVAGAVGPDLAGLGEVRDVLGGVARPRHVGLARLQRGADGVDGRDEEAVVAELRRGPASPMRVMMRMDDGDVGGVGDLDAELRRSREPSGPMQNGTTYIVRPRIAAARRALARRSRASRRGRSSCWSGRRPPRFSEQMKVRSSTRATSRGVGGGVEGVRALGRVELLERALLDQQLASGASTPPRSRRTSRPGPAGSARRSP